MEICRKSILFLVILFFVLFGLSQAMAGSPSGSNWFQLLASPFTGGDNTGDGGTGNPNDFNYYYVGQTWTEIIQISSNHTNAANIWIDLDSQIVTSSNLSTGTYFPNWSGQTTSYVSGTIFRIKSTGYQTGNTSGIGTFGSVQFTALKPTAANYSTSAPATLLINIGTIGATTESNISYLGADILESAENSGFHVWADTNKPYALNPSPSNGGIGATVESNYTFDLRDSKNGEGDNSGSGTGVDTATPPGTITVNDGTGAVDYTAYDSYGCSGAWGTNLCGVTLNPPSPSGIPGDTRNWKYNTSYTVNISGYRDRASASQNQLGDPNGPNTMNAKSWTFTSEGDTIAPRVQAESPARGSSGNSVSTNVSVDVLDKKTYPGTISGVGVNSSTCRIRIQSPTFGNTLFQPGDAGVTVTPIDYGFRYTIDPATDFAQSETVSISVSDCQDLATNTMTTDNYTFTTSDSNAPYVDTLNPANDTTIAQSDNISFHIKDDGSGVDLANTVIYLNGTYYTNGGGAGQVTTNGTRITFASSLNFNGGNYSGDTTSRTGSSGDYTFTLDPETNFAVGEAVPVIIYTRDSSGNLMERYVYGLTVAGGSCPAGSSYCGSNSTWDAGLLKCLGTGGGTTTTTTAPYQGGGTATPAAINPGSASVTQIDETSVLVIWYTNNPGNGRVVYDSVGPSTIGPSPNFNYRYSSKTVDNNSSYHSFIIDNLKTGQVYYFRPVSYVNGQLVLGSEMVMAPKFATILPATPAQCAPAGKQPVCAPCPTAGVPAKPGLPSSTATEPATPETTIQKILKILNIEIKGVAIDGQNIILINGKSAPSVNLKMTIY